MTQLAQLPHSTGALPRFVANIYDPAFYVGERVLAAQTPTVVFDMDQTVASERGGPEFILRPGIVDLLAKLKNENLRLALWSGATGDKVARLLQSQPRLQGLFNVVIAKEAYVQSAEIFANASEQPDACAGCYAKEIGFFKYALLVDDNPDTLEFGHSGARHGNFQTVLVRKFFPYRMQPGKVWERDTDEIYARIRQMLAITKS